MNEQLKKLLADFLEAQNAAFRARMAVENFLMNAKSTDYALQELEAAVCSATDGKMTREEVEKGIDRFSDSFQEWLNK